MFTINKLLFVFSTMILLSIGMIHNPTLANAASTNISTLSSSTHNVPPTLEEQIKKITEDIQATNSKLEQANLMITITKYEIEQLTKEIDDLGERIADRKLIINKRLQSYQQAGGSGTYLEVLLNAKSFTTLESTETETVQTIQQQQDSEKAEFKYKKETLDQKLTELAYLQADFERLQTQLPIQQKQFDLLNTQLEKNKEVPEKIEEKENTYVRIVTTAGNKYIGKSTYVFGGGRNERDIARGDFDCSGFVHWVFEQAGIKLGTSTDSIKNSGKRISVQDMKPGDLIFFDTYKKDGHIGIYLGDGKFIGSQCSTGVAIEDMTQGYWKNKFKGHVERVS